MNQYNITTRNGFYLFNPKEGLTKEGFTTEYFKNTLKETIERITELNNIILNSLPSKNNPSKNNFDIQEASYEIFTLSVKVFALEALITSFTLPERASQLTSKNKYKEELITYFAYKLGNHNNPERNLSTQRRTEIDIEKAYLTNSLYIITRQDSPTITVTD